MSWLYIIPIVIIVGALFIKKYKFSKKDIVNILFYGLVITFLALISTLILPKIIPSLQDHGFRSFFRILIMAGVVEEVAKFFGIKLSKPKNADQIFVFSILIALVFSVVEDFGYFSIYESGALFSRILTPIHLTFQLIMAYFLIKAFLIKDTDKSKAKLYTSLSLIVPILVHAIYDTYIGILIPRFVAYVVGVLTYVVVVVYILKMKTNNEISTSNDGMLNGENTIQPTINQPTAEKEKISIFKIIVIILLFLFFILLSNPSSKYTKVNTEKT